MKNTLFLCALALGALSTLNNAKADNKLPIKPETIWQKAERGFQEDADLVRLADLAYWTGLIEAYKEKQGHYPLQNELRSKDDIILVKVATRIQRQFLSRPRLNNNKGGRFNEKTMKQFVSVLSSGLGKAIDERYDIQKAPTHSPVGYNYFVTQDGYLFWVTCITCGVTPISTLLMDGVTPTVNIASEGMLDKVTKAQSRQAMLNHPMYQQWMARPYHKADFVKQRVQENIHESQNTQNAKNNQDGEDAQDGQHVHHTENTAQNTVQNKGQKAIPKKDKTNQNSAKKAK